jgi:hypothetical protein
MIQSSLGCCRFCNLLEIDLETQMSMILIKDFAHFKILSHSIFTDLKTSQPTFW